jgi:hypothetical protein
MFKPALASSMIVAMLGCSQSTEIEAAKAMIEASVRDPGSLQFRNLQAYTEGVVCGEFNAKNGYGGYAGFGHSSL